MVRVSRRVNDDHFVRIPSATNERRPSAGCRPKRNFVPQRRRTQQRSTHQELRARASAPQSTTVSKRRAISSRSLTSKLPSRRQFQPLRIHSDLDPNDRIPNHSRHPSQVKLRNHKRQIECSPRIARVITSRHPFVLSNFKYFLTLFSKFFSSFPHGTCSLSVSHMYLALDEIYHPLRTALPSNPTLRRRLVRDDGPAKDGILTLSDSMFQLI